MKLEEVVAELETIESFKNINASFNEEKNIFDIYCRITIPKEEAEDLFNEIDEIDYNYCDFGIFEFWFAADDAEVAIQKLKEVF